MKYLYENFEEISYEIGIIESFCEMVGVGLKPLALSHPISKEDYPTIDRSSKEVAKKFGVKSYTEEGLISTNLTPDEYVADKYVILYYKDYEILERYIRLRDYVNKLKSVGSYGTVEKESATSELKKILGYSV